MLTVTIKNMYTSYILKIIKIMFLKLPLKWKSDGKNIEVISGLSQGDLIVSEGIRKLVDNSE